MHCRGCIIKAMQDTEFSLDEYEAIQETSEATEPEQCNTLQHWEDNTIRCIGEKMKW